MNHFADAAFTDAVSKTIDRYQGSEDPFSLNLYDWNARVKSAKDQELTGLVHEFKDCIFVDFMGGLLTSPVIIEELLIKRDRKDRDGETIRAPLLWNERELIRFEKLSLQRIEKKTHLLASAILELPCCQEMMGIMESPIEDFDSEDEEDTLFNRKELSQMNKSIQRVLRAMQQIIEAKNLVQVFREGKQQREETEKESARKNGEVEAACQAKAAEKIQENAKIRDAHVQAIEERQQECMQARAINSESEKRFLEAMKEKYIEEYHIRRQEEELRRVRKQIEETRV